LILDGESISLILERGFIGRHPISVITPHEGELRHCGLDLQTPLSADARKKVAHQIAHDREVIVVLKGNKTVIASPEGEIFVDEIGGPELATAGSGDILAGLIGSFLVSAKDMSGAMDLVCRAVTLHSHVGRFAAERFTSVTALEILDSLAHV
jgi:NAD(P)H-hydrate epimerase